MSTHLRVRNPKGLATTAFISVWLVACAGAWDASTTSGGGDATAAEARAVAAAVSKTARLTPACSELAAQLAEASIRARIAEWRPTSRLFAGRKADAYARWEAGRCPDRALPGIAFGVAEAANASEEARRRGTVSRWPG